MANLLSLAALQSLSRDSTGEIWLALLTISHPNLGSPIRLVRDTQDRTSNGNVFTAFFFDVQLMSSEEGREPEARLVLDHVDRSVLNLIDGLNEPPAVTIEYVLASDLDTVIAKNVGLEMIEITVTTRHLGARLFAPDFFNETVPGTNMNRRNTPGIFA